MKHTHTHSITQSHSSRCTPPLTFISCPLLLLHAFDLLPEDFGQKLFELVPAQRRLEGSSQGPLSLLQLGYLCSLQLQLLVTRLQLRLSGQRGEDVT